MKNDNRTGKKNGNWRVWLAAGLTLTFFWLWFLEMPQAVGRTLEKPVPALCYYAIPVVWLAYAGHFLKNR